MPQGVPTPATVEGSSLISLNPSTGNVPSRFNCFAFLIKNTNWYLSTPNSRAKSVDFPLHCSQTRITSAKTSSLTLVRLPLLDLNVLSLFRNIALSIQHLLVLVISNYQNFLNRKCGAG